MHYATPRAWHGRIVASLFLALAAAVPAGSLHANLPTTYDGRAAFLEAHNRERSAVGVPPLEWSDDLARRAAEWAATLAKAGYLAHASATQRNNEGENLWVGLAGAFGPADMVNCWAGERAAFRPAPVPMNSNTGNWADVGHFTQIVWKKTTRVGCATATARGQVYLVCRYDRPGNVVGEQAF